MSSCGSPTVSGTAPDPEVMVTGVLVTVRHPPCSGRGGKWEGRAGFGVGRGPWVSAGPLTAPLRALTSGSVGRQGGAVTAPSADAPASGDRVGGPGTAQGEVAKGRLGPAFLPLAQCSLLSVHRGCWPLFDEGCVSAAYSLTSLSYTITN